ncbi:MAG: hypothetical protein D6773_11145 [Alphaproteobacteria bacterium]|nr:MAG: hypothetical protein D6773_11145 [Alphaproteobacteria bacterium]
MTTSPTFPIVSGPVIDMRSGIPTRAFALFLHQLWQRTSDPAGNEVDAASQAASGAQSSADLALAQAQAAAGQAGGHAAQTVAHGSSGNIVGRDDRATATEAGVVLMAQAIADLSQSYPALTKPDAPAAAAAYSQADTQATVDLVNEIKAALASLLIAAKAIEDKQAELHAVLRSAGIMG